MDANLAFLGDQTSSSGWFSELRGSGGYFPKVISVKGSKKVMCCENKGWEVS
jgi:hypothetical protein